MIDVLLLQRYLRLTKFNHEHVPGGSPEGGEFASLSAPGTEAEINTATGGKYTPAATARLAKFGLTRDMIASAMEEDFAHSKPEDKDWYRRAHQTALDLATKYHITPRAALGVIAALSPQRKWDGVKNGNVEAATAVLDMVTSKEPFPCSAYGADHNKGKFTEGQMLDPTTLTPLELAQCHPDSPFQLPGAKMIVPAILIAEGADLDSTLGGPKVRSFFNNMATPDSGESATMDAWMFRSGTDNYDINWGPKFGVMKPSVFRDTPKNKKGDKNGYSAIGATMQTSPSPGKMGGGLYAVFADAVRANATKRGLLPSEYQAMVWQGAHRREGRPT